MSKTLSLITERNKIELTDSQNSMVNSGWGEETIKKTIVEKITYLSDGLKIKGFLAYPKNTSKKYPCIIWNRGGIGDRGVIDSFTARGLFGQLASWGYVVFASQYRGNDGGEGKDEFGGNDINDVLNLTPLAKEFEFANDDRWGIEGWSRGGMMTYLALTKKDHPAYPEDGFKCAVITGGIANLRCNSDESPFMRRLYEVTMGPHNDDEFNKKCELRSIINFPEKLSKTTPMLIFHGTADTRVLPHDSLDLSYHLIKHNIPFRLIMLEGGDHFMRKHRKEADEMRRKWYEKYLI